MNSPHLTTATRDATPASPGAGASAGPDADAGDLADLQRLAPELAALGYTTRLLTAPGRLPCLEVRNPRASLLTERVYAQADSYWYSWGEHIAGCDQPAAAAAILARVLRTADPAVPDPAVP
jgi:hypothetical protein